MIPPFSNVSPMSVPAVFPGGGNLPGLCYFSGDEKIPAGLTAKSGCARNAEDFFSLCDLCVFFLWVLCG